MRRIILGVILAAALVMCLSPPVFAAGTQTEVTFTYAPPGPSYTIEADGSWTRGSRNGLIVTTNAELSKFIGVKVDGILLDAKNYTAVSGSTIVTLKPEYLETLAIGEHSIELVFTDGSVQTWFTVRDYSGNQGAEPGNTTPGQQGGNTPAPPDSTPPGGVTVITPGDTPLVDLPEKLPVPKDDSHTVVPDSERPNVYIEIDENGVPVGEWHRDGDSGVWIFDEYPPLAGLPQTGVVVLSLSYLFSMLGISLVGMGVVLKKRSELKKGAKP